MSSSPDHGDIASVADKTPSQKSTTQSYLPLSLAPKKATKKGRPSLADLRLRERALSIGDIGELLTGRKRTRDTPGSNQNLDDDTYPQKYLKRSSSSPSLSPVEKEMSNNNTESLEQLPVPEAPNFAEISNQDAFKWMADQFVALFRTNQAQFTHVKKLINNSSTSVVTQLQTLGDKFVGIVEEVHNLKKQQIEINQRLKEVESGKCCSNQNFNNENLTLIASRIEELEKVTAPNSLNQMKGEIKCQLDKLTKIIETQKSMARRQNIIINGFESTNTPEDIANFLANTFSIPKEDCKNIKQSGKTKDCFVVHFEKPEHKALIMRTKKVKLSTLNIFISNDLTPIESQKAFEIRKKLKEEKEKGNNPKGKKTNKVPRKPWEDTNLLAIKASLVRHQKYCRKTSFTLVNLEILRSLKKALKKTRKQNIERYYQNIRDTLARTNKPADFCRAFDSVPHHLLWAKLFKLGISGKIIRTVQAIYEKVNIQLKINGENFKPFDVTEGVLQGGKLSPTLFILYIEDLIDFLDSKGIQGINIGLNYLRTLLFADDAVFFAGSIKEVKKTLCCLEEYFEANKLKVHTEKTQILVCRSSGRIRKKEKDTFQYNDQPIKSVSQYNHLGTIIDSGVKGKFAANEAANKAKVATGTALSILAKAKADSWQARVKIFNSLVAPTMLYGAEIWGLDYLELIDKTQTDYYKKILQLPRNTPGYMIRLETGITHLSITTLKQTWR
ncbi:Similar to LINE-1 reverse transcriptase homolog (Nycticebus coucang) [Cotesia congregata]|uniref:Similar to LINE-1 reverse transcriptase homolog (Nycticebus coucang) n=1 Tax=Cotesia congregata TaxID=51543 RepID=A0A8J2HBY9_COTCN|nr:Similar to LINE-1 reverse transcriptase homolog (Nycticebus coucang) [Cotesia congregata]